MAQSEGPPKSFRELNFRARRGEPNTFPQKIEALTEQMRSLAEDLGTIANKYGFSDVKATVQKPDDLLGTIEAHRDPFTGELAIIVDDRRLDEEITKMPEGVPYFAPEDAFYFHRPKPDKPDLVPDPKNVQVGQAIVWLWIDKVRQWGIATYDAGQLTWRIENGTYAHAGNLIFAVKPHEAPEVIEERTEIPNEQTE